MNELRQEVRASFEKQQAALGGDLAGVRQRLLRTALAAPDTRRTQLFRTAVGLAVVLMAAAAVGATIFIRERTQSAPAVTHSPSASAQPTPSPTSAPTALAEPLQVPASTPVILYHDPVKPDQIDGITWDGTASGRIAATGGAFGLVPNPMGTLYAGFSDSGIHDRSGQLVARYESGGQKGFAGWWADDGLHYCQMVSASALPPAGGEPATLRLAAPGVATRNVAQVGAFGDQFGVRVVLCSVVRDRAIVVQESGQGFSARQYWVVQLSTGRILWTRSPQQGTGFTNVWASADGQYIAEVKGGMVGQASETTILGAGGSVLGHVAGSAEGFSSDGALVVLSGSDGSVSVIRWRDGTHVWDAPHGLTLYDVLAEPGSQRIAVALRNPDYQQTGGFPPVDLYVVGPDGQATELLQKVGVAL